MVFIGFILNYRCYVCSKWKLTKTHIEIIIFQCFPPRKRRRGPICVAISIMRQSPHWLNRASLFRKQLIKDYPEN